MSEMVRCDDKNLLIAYLYDEVDPRERRLVEDHLRTCAACAGELGALRGVREELSAWAPPVREFGFAVVPTRRPGGAAGPERRAGEAEPHPRGLDGSAHSLASRWRELPAWAQAVAAIFVLAAGAGAANLHIRSGPDGLSVTTGWMSRSAVSAVSAAADTPAGGREAAPVGAASDDWRPALAALESRMRGELQALRQAGAARPVTTTAPGNELTLRRVQALIDESAKRQQQELALRLTQFSRDMELQRVADLRRIERSMGEVGLAGAEVRQMMNYLRRVSVPQQ
jgi:hypothetical protein